MCSDCGAYETKKHGLTRSDCICNITLINSHCIRERPNVLRHGPLLSSDLDVHDVTGLTTLSTSSMTCV